MAAPTKSKAKKAKQPSKRKAKRKKKSVMQNLVGHTVPTLGEIQKAVDSVEEIGTQSGKYTISLTQEQRQGAPKYRDKSDREFAQIAALVKKHGVVVPNITLGDMQADLLLAARLQPLAKVLASVSAKVTDTIFEAHAEAWWAMTTYYKVLDSMSSADAELDKDLEMVREFFATGARAVEESGDPPPDGSSSDGEAPVDPNAKKVG